MKIRKYRFGCIKYTLLAIILTHATLSIAFNTESAMNYHFSHKITAQPHPTKTSKIGKISEQQHSNTSKISPAAIPSVPKSKTSLILQCPIVLKPPKHKIPVTAPIPIKAAPQFGTVAARPTTNYEYLYNGILNSSFYFNYNSTIFHFNQNSMNITYPLEKRHK